jgi:hypothetical protein
VTRQATVHVVVQDVIDGPAIRDSPRRPTLDEARAILGSVLDRGAHAIR